MPSRNTLPRFTQNPFKREGSPEASPPGSPPKPWAKRLSIPAIPKHMASKLTGDSSRKPSVATFHGDLVAEKFRKDRRKMCIKGLTYVTIFLVGLIVGIVIGHWAIPKYTSYVSSTTSDNVASSVKDSTDAASTTSTASASKTSATYWQPTSGVTYQVELSTVIDSTSDLPSTIDVYETDLFETSATTIAGLKAAGKHVICYFSAGSAENWRTDFSEFTAADLGNEVEGWAGEYWVYTPSDNVRKIMAARLALAQQKGCDGVDPDLVDVYAYSDPGFTDLTTTTAIDYLTFLADEAHSLGLAIGLKNSGAILDKIEPVMDYSISESCVENDECDIYQPFVAAGKPAFNVQYPFETSDDTSTDVTSDLKSKYCTGTANVSGFTIVLKHEILDAWLYQC